MQIIQLLLLAFFLFAALKAVWRYRSGDIGGAGLVYWVLFWAAAGVIVAWPDATFYFAKKLGIGRGSDLVVYLSLVLLFFLVFRLMVSFERQKKEVTELTRLQALKNIK